MKKAYFNQIDFKSPSRHSVLYGVLYVKQELSEKEQYRRFFSPSFFTHAFWTYFAKILFNVQSANHIVKLLRTDVLLESVVIIEQIWETEKIKNDTTSDVKQSKRKKIFSFCTDAKFWLSFSYIFWIRYLFSEYLCLALSLFISHATFHLSKRVH